MTFEDIQKDQLVDDIVVHRLRRGDVAIDHAVDLGDAVGVIALDGRAERAARQLAEPARQRLLFQLLQPAAIVRQGLHRAATRALRAT